MVEGKSHLSLSDEDRNLSCGPEHLFGSTKNQGKCVPLVDSAGGGMNCRGCKVLLIMMCRGILQNISYNVTKGF